MATGQYLRDVACTVCCSSPCMHVLTIPGVPVHCNILCQRSEEALRAPTASISLAFCPACGHLFNSAFDARLMKYGPGYENSLHWSPRFQQYAGALASSLIARYALRHKNIIEIGCGSGEFLALLCERGRNRGWGFDPGCPDPADGSSAANPVVLIRDSYSAKYANYHADLICCRHTLEHIEDPRAFVRRLREAVGERRKTTVFFEVPNMLFTIQDLGIWDLIFEHCSYFSRSSLVHLFSSSAFRVLRAGEGFGSQFLRIEAAPARANGASRPLPGPGWRALAGKVERFRSRYTRKVESWRERLGLAGRRLVVWGAGSKGVTFLNTLGVRDQIQYVVDINPRKHGMYVPGTGQRIVPPEFLREYRPKVVVVMNGIYRNEIRQLTGRLGLDVKYIYA